jgi:hypothetical protein
MRTLCLALILLNALYFAWAQLIDGNPSDMDFARPDVVRPLPIELATEVEISPPEPALPSPANRDNGQPMTAPAVPTAAVAPAAATTASNTCTSVGPFSTLAEASRAQTALRAIGFSSRQRYEASGRIWVGYWVSQQLKTQRQAEAALKMLKDSGIIDVFLLPGSNPPTLSLGVFADYQRAQKRVEQIRVFGYDPGLSDRTREDSVFWVDVDILQAGQSIDTGIFQSDQGRIMRLELRACPQAQASVQSSRRAG